MNSNPPYQDVNLPRQEPIDLALVIIDMQLPFLQNVSARERNLLIGTQRRLIDACNTYNRPIALIETATDVEKGIVFEQDQTIPEIRDAIIYGPHAKLFIKQTASAYQGTGLLAFLKEQQCTGALYQGVDASLCVYQSALDGRKENIIPVTVRGGIADEPRVEEKESSSANLWFAQQGVYFRHAADAIALLRR